MSLRRAPFVVANLRFSGFFRWVGAWTLRHTQGWLTLAMSSTLAGNLTILGSVANPIVVQRARQDLKITFWEHLRAGVPFALLTLAVGAAWLQGRQ